ncbi:predicted protein [Naegleria gruberi]|uniref:Predicted protein n=1 Tax=Naegleria gruberi TaxID=5762 RepID=D2VSL2_NAEGR|nr:uncharacterized protein NAEGRDRAFT_59109 [Naegleria gruberi]EFC40141.1 predicted protein [Naegleria gruberi]|eukprot:XP_002672885.1 predicted protein [Naegleria gruberi strain NEG-M]
MPANVGTRRKLNPNLKKGYVAPPVEDHIIIEEDQKQKSQQQQPVKTKKQQQPIANTSSPATTTTTNKVVTNANVPTTTTTTAPKAKNVKSSSESRFEKYEKQHEAFIKQMETFMKSFLDFEKERLAFMKEQFGSKSVGTTTTTQTTVANNKKDNKTITATTTTTPTKTTTPPPTNTTVKTTTATAATTTPKKKTTEPTTTPQNNTNVTSPKSTKNEAAKNKDPAVDASPTKQQTKKATTTTSPTTTATTTTTTVPTKIRELTVTKDEIFDNLKVVYVSGENIKAIAEANKVFDTLEKKDAVYGFDILWNAKEEKTINESPTETHILVPIRLILLANHDTVFVYRPPTAEEMLAEKIDRPLPVALYKILTQNQCVKVSFNAIEKVNYLYHNLNTTYVSHVSDINSLFVKEPYGSALDMLSKELELPTEQVSKELKMRHNINYSKELSNGQLVTVAKRCWLELRLVEKFSEKQKTKTNLFDFVTKNMKIED